MKIKMRKIVFIAMALLCLSFSVFMIVSRAEEETHLGECERIVRQYSYSDAIAYINDQNENTYPKEEGYIFAGWYTDEACQQGYWGQEKPGENIYALFVPSHILSVKAQVSANLINDGLGDDGTASIRFVTTVDSLLYTKSGFDISYTANGVEKNVTKSSNMVYSRLYAVREINDSSTGKTIYEEDGIVYTPQKDFCNLSTYFKACTVKNIPLDNYTTQFTVKPFWYTVDGSKVYGETAVKTIKEYFEMSDVYVSKDGEDTLKNGTEDQPFKTLEYALGMVENGGRIHIKDSYTAAPDFVWEEHDKSVTITGGTIDFSALQIVTGDSPAIEASMLHIGDAVTFKNIKLNFASGAHVFAQGHTLEIAEGVTFSEKITLCGGAYLSEIKGDTNLILKSGEYTTIYGGGYGGRVTGNTHITLSGVVNESADYTSHESNATKGGRKLFGGGYAAPVTGNTNVKVQSTLVEFNYIFGGGHFNNVIGDTHIEYAGSAMALFGGGLSGTVTGNTYVTMTGGWAHQIFGGCHGKDLTGSANVDVQGGTIERRVYGGCYNGDDWSTTAHVKGYATVSISKDAIVEMDYGSDDSLVALSRTNVIFEDEKGVFVFNDYNDNRYVSKIGINKVWPISFSRQFYNYLVKAESGGTVSAEGEYLIITPSEGKAAKVMINGVLMHYAESKTAYKLPTLASSSDRMEVLVTFGEEDTSIDKSAYEARIEGGYYSSLEEAVEAAKVMSTEEQTVTVTLLKNVEIETTMNITDASNVAVQSEGTNKYTINRASTLISADGKIFAVSAENTFTINNVILDGRTVAGDGSTDAAHEATLIYNEGATNVENVTAQYSTRAANQTKGSDAVLSLDTVAITNTGKRGLVLSSGMSYAKDVTINHTNEDGIGIGTNATFYMNNVSLTDIGSEEKYNGISNHGTIYTADDAEHALTVQTVQGHAVANIENGTVLLNGVTIEDVVSTGIDAVHSEGGVIVIANATITDTARDGIYLNAGTMTAVNTTIQDVTRGGITVAGTGKAIARDVTVKKFLAKNSSTYAIYSYGANATAELVNVIIEDAKTAGVFAEKGTVLSDGLTITRGAKGVYSNEGTLGTEMIPMKGVTIQDTTGHGVHSVKGTTYFGELDVLNVKGKGVAIQGGTATIKNATIDGAGTTSSEQSGVFAGASSGASNVTLDNVAILNTTLYGLEVNASNVIVNENGINIESVAQHGIANLSSGTVEAQKVTIGETVMSGVYTKASTTKIYSGTITGSGENGVHAVSGTSILENVAISNASTAGIQSENSAIVQTKDVTITGGAAGIESTGGTVEKVEGATTGITINGTAYGIKNISGTTTLKNVAVNNTTTAGVYVEKGTLNTESVVVAGGPVGIETIEGTVTGVAIENITQVGIKKESGTSNVKNVTITNAKKSDIVGVKVTDGTLHLDTVNVTGGDRGIYATGGMLGTSDTSIKNVTITGTNNHALQIANATIYADDLDISNILENTKKGIVVQGGTAVVKNSTINNIDDSAVYIAKGSATATVTLEGVDITKSGAYGIQMGSANNITTTLNSVTIDQAASGIATGGILTIDGLTITGAAKCMDVKLETTITGKVSFTPTSYTECAVVVVNGTAERLAAVSGLVDIMPDANGGVWFANSEGKLTKAYAKIGDTFYTSFANAMSSAVADDTIMLFENVAVSETIVIDKNLTFASNKEVEIQWNSDAKTAMFQVDSGKTLTIKGTGEGKKIVLKKNKTTDTSNNVILNKGTTVLDYVEIDGGRIGLNSEGTSINVNHLTVKNTANKGIAVKTGNAVIANTIVQNTGDTGFYIYSGAKQIELDNVTVRDIDCGKGGHGVTVDTNTAIVTVQNKLTIDNVSGHGIAVQKGAFSTDVSTNGTIEVKNVARAGIYATVAINVKVTSISGCAEDIGAMNATIVINGISKDAGSTVEYYSLSDFTSN